MDIFGIQAAIEWQREQRKWRERTDKYFYDAFKKSNEESEKFMEKILAKKEEKTQGLF